MKRTEYKFYYNNVEIFSGWYDSQKDAQLHAQGICVGIRQFRRKACVDVYRVEEENGQKILRLAFVQR